MYLYIRPWFGDLVIALWSFGFWVIFWHIIFADLEDPGANGLEVTFCANQTNLPWTGNGTLGIHQWYRSKWNLPKISIQVGQHIDVKNTWDVMNNIQNSKIPNQQKSLFQKSTAFHGFLGTTTKLLGLFLGPVNHPTGHQRVLHRLCAFSSFASSSCMAERFTTHCRSLASIPGERLGVEDWFTVCHQPPVFPPKNGGIWFKKPTKALKITAGWWNKTRLLFSLSVS